MTTVELIKNELTRAEENHESLTERLAAEMISVGESLIRRADQIRNGSTPNDLGELQNVGINSLSARASDARETVRRLTVLLTRAETEAM